MRTFIPACLIVLLSIPGGQCQQDEDQIIWENFMNGLIIDEALPIGTEIYTLLAYFKGQTPGTSTGIQYGFNDKAINDFSVSGDSNGLRIDPVTGVVSILTPLDFDGVLDINSEVIEKQTSSFSVGLIATGRLNDRFWAKKVRAEVFLKNLNDVTPRFVNDSLRFRVNENIEIPPGGLVIADNIIVTDVDGIFDAGLRQMSVTIQNCIIDQKFQNICPTWFRLQSTNNNDVISRFDLVLVQSLNFEDARAFQVQLLADDGKQQSNTDVVIIVGDIQDQGPEWIEFPSITITRDNLPVGDLQIKVLAEDQDSEEIKREVRYEIIPGLTNEGIPIDSIFRINPVTGNITNLVVLDIEDPVYFKDGNLVRDEWNIIVKACEVFANGNLTTECTVEVTLGVKIEDRNDNGPTFNQNVYQYTIREDILNGSYVNDPPIVIVDPDMEGFNEYNTELVVPSNEFALIGATSNPIIIVKNSTLIDYDNGPKQYTLNLRTYDLNDNRFVDQATVIIDVTDVNDITPRFTRTVYEAFISELSQEGEFVITVTANDIDSGLFGNQGIKYSFTGGGRNLFKMDEVTGTVTVAFCSTYGVRPCLDYDSPTKSYDFTVYATDFLAQSGNRQGTATLRVNLLDENDNPPSVGDYKVSMFESTRVFTSPLIVNGTDPDPGAVLTYRIVSQTPGSFWQINSITGEITTSKPFPQTISYDDTQQTGFFNLVVEVSDSVYTARSNVEIEVFDINDKAPVFLPNYYEIAINETTLENTYLLTLTATDQDDPTSPNGQLVYTINSGNTGGRFTVDENTGKLFTSPDATFDFNLRNLYNLTVRVNDKGTPQQSGLGIVIVRILDLNNKNPVLDPFLQRFTVSEDQAIGTYVGTLQARDEDANARLIFRFTNNRAANSINGFPVNVTTFDYTNLFRISDDGEIFVNAKLDAEKANIITYSAEVEDISAISTQVGPGTVVFTVQKFNSIPPEFVDLPKNIIVKEERPLGTVITTIIATDDDGILEYKINEEQNPYFTISPSSGIVQIIGRIDYDDARMLNSSSFEVTVSDRGKLSLTSTATVNVVFTNINDNFPQFVRSANQPDQRVNLYTARIPENSPNGTPVVQVFTIDNDRPDENGFHLVRYYMNDTRFDVNELTGEIFVNLKNGAELNREAGSRILAQVVARDNPNRSQGEPQLQRAASISITLTDVNDNPPVFNRKEYFVVIFETIPLDPGTILQLFINDEDLGENAVSFFTKIPNAGDDYDDLFDVSRELGQVYVKKDLKGKTGFYNFFVQAQDKLGTGFITNVSVRVEVKPSANSPPIWIKPRMDNMTIFVLEEQYAGMLVYDVSARDLDTGDNGIVDYSFIFEGETTQATPEFKINPVTGVIQAEIIYDREKVERYVVLLKASDRGETKLETTRFLTIVVRDVNDNVPTFPQNEVEFPVDEDADINFSVGRVRAEDKDLDPVIIYRIISGNEEGVFRIDETSGEIFLVKTLNTEDKSIYYIQVQASNDEPDYTVIRNRRKRAIDPSIVTVKIVVGDINDLAPVFLEERYYGCISTRSQFGKHILTLRAVDRDAIGTGIVRYSLNGTRENGFMIGNNYFTIHPKFGILTNTVLMRSHADKMFDLTVNARDGLDPADSESANTNVKVFVTQPGKEVKLLITQNTAEVRLYQQQIQSIIEQSANIDYLCILDIEDHVIDSVGSTSTLWSDVYVSGIRVESNGQHKILSSRELKNVIDFEKVNRKNDFDLLYIKEVETASSSDELDLDDKAVIIILIIIAVLIFLVIIFCIVAFMCIKAAKTQKKQRLVHKTNSPPPAPVIMAVHEPEPEPVIYDNRGYISDPEPQMVQEEQEVISPAPVHVQYAVVRKGAEPPVQYETEYYTSNPADDEVIVVPLDENYPEQQQPAVYEPQQDEGDDDDYRIETEVQQM